MASEQKNPPGVQSAAMPKVTTTTSRASLVELIKRTNQTPVRIKTET
jgi:hypothetical protein